MALSPRLDLRQSQSLVMTPQMQQAVKLLALSNLELEAHIGAALEANPLLEIGDLRAESVEDRAEPYEAEAGPGSDGAEALDIGEAALDPERAPGDGDWSTAAGNSPAGELPEQATNPVSLAEHLLGQLSAGNHAPSEALIASRIIGELDECGYFHADLDMFAHELGASTQEVLEALRIVQSFDPAGIAARTLAECLELQARRADRFDPCMARLIANLDVLGRGDVERLRRLCKVDEDDFADMLAELRSYDPKPGCAFASDEASAIEPDVLLMPDGTDGWIVRLNEATLPRLVVNRDYYVELAGGCRDKTSTRWLDEQLDEAHWLLRALDQRQRTILKAASAIVELQAGFFRDGVAAMRTLTLAHVAERIDMHESTVSRATANKYMHCPMGTFELKYFFSSGVSTETGGEASSEAVKARIKALTEAEGSKSVLSDDKLVTLLKAEGFDIARRTVAKYREAMGIGSSVERRRALKLRGR